MVLLNATLDWFSEADQHNMSPGVGRPFASDAMVDSVTNRQAVAHRDPLGPVTPPLRWAGGKQNLVTALLRFLPTGVSNLAYFEPFLGAGSLFFALRPPTATLADANRHLIDCYRFVRDNPDLVSDYLRVHAARSSKQHYYKIRTAYNAARPSAAQASSICVVNDQWRTASGSARVRRKFARL